MPEKNAKKIIDDKIKALEQEIENFSNQIKRNEGILDAQKRRLEQLLGKLEGLREIKESLG